MCANANLTLASNKLLRSIQQPQEFATEIPKYLAGLVLYPGNLRSTKLSANILIPWVSVTKCILDFMVPGFDWNV